MAETSLLPSPAELAPLTNAKKPASDAGLSSGLPPSLAPIKSISVEHEDGSKTLHIPAPIAKATNTGDEANVSQIGNKDVGFTERNNSFDGSVAPNPAIAKSPALLPSPDYVKMVDSPESIPSVPTSGKSLSPVGPKPSGASADSSSNGVSNTSAGGEQSLGAPADAANLATQLKPLPEFGSNTNATPSLEPQGGKHPFTRFLSRLTGLSAETPKPGQPYTGPVGSGEKIKAGAKFAEAIGYGLTAVAGRPEESELAMQMPMKKRQMELETAALKNEATYRTGMLANSAEKNDIARQKAAGAMTAKGYKEDPQNPGQFIPKTPEEISADPMLNVSSELKQASIQAANAKAEYQKTLSYYQAHPNAQVQAQLEIADKRLKSMMMMFHARFGMEQARLSMQGTESMYQFGRNALTGEDLSAENAPPGMLADASGSPIPTRMQNIFAPTGQQKTSAGRASVMLSAIPSTVQTIDAMRDELGPYLGRWNEFMQGKIGADDPAFASLRMNLSLISSGVTLAHSLGRMPSELFDEFSTQINAPQQSPDNLIAVLKTVTPYLQQIQDVGKPRAISPIHRAAGASSGGAEIEYVRNAQGKLVKKGQ